MGIETNRCPTCGKAFIPTMKFCPFDSSVLEPFVIQDVTTEEDAPSSEQRLEPVQSAEVEILIGSRPKMDYRGGVRNAVSSLFIALLLVFVGWLIVFVYNQIEAGKTQSVVSGENPTTESEVGWATPVFEVPEPAKPILDAEENTSNIRTNNFGMDLIWISPGSFMMGSPYSEPNRALDEGPQRVVTISEGFWMGKYEVTQGQYEEVMGTNPSHFKTCGKDCPVETVSWNDAKEFIKRLNDRNDGFVYALPTEAEWEYAARAGTTTAFAFGDSLSSTEANFNGKYPFGNASEGPNLKSATKVGSYKPNEWGLHDMHGNVWEWVEDIYQNSYRELPMDGSANTTTGDRSLRVLRGGSWLGIGNLTRSAYRNWSYPTLRLSNIGFRVVVRAKNQ